MSNNLIVLPLLIPLLTGIVLIFINRHRKLVRWVSGVSSIINIFIAASVVENVRLDGVQILNMSGWEAPFGITFTADMFAALLVLTTTFIGAACIFYSFYTIEEQRERHYYYALVQFLLVGVIGSFLTGDIFQLIRLLRSHAGRFLRAHRNRRREETAARIAQICSDQCASLRLYLSRRLHISMVLSVR